MSSCNINWGLSGAGLRGGGREYSRQGGREESAGGMSWERRGIVEGEGLEKEEGEGIGRGSGNRRKWWGEGGMRRRGQRLTENVVMSMEHLISLYKMMHGTGDVDN